MSCEIKSGKCCEQAVTHVYRYGGRYWSCRGCDAAITQELKEGHELSHLEIPTNHDEQYDALILFCEPTRLEREWNFAVEDYREREPLVLLHA